MSRRSCSAEMTVRLARDELYHYWNDVEQYPRFIPGLRRVDVLDQVWSIWTFDGAWDIGKVEVEVTDRVLHHYVAWRLHAKGHERTGVRLEGAPAGPTRAVLETSWSGQHARGLHVCADPAQILQNLAVLVRQDHGMSGP